MRYKKGDLVRFFQHNDPAGRRLGIIIGLTTPTHYRDAGDTITSEEVTAYKVYWMMDDDNRKGGLRNLYTRGYAGEDLEIVNEA